MADEELTALIRLESDLRGAQETQREIKKLDKAAEQANKRQTESAQRAQRAAVAHKKAISDLSSSYSKFSNSIGGASAATANLIKNVGSGTVKASALGFGALTGWAVKTTSDIEQINIALTTFVGDTMGKQLFGQLRELDKMSPFTFPELADTARQLAAFGVGVNQIQGLTSSISEIASGSGKGAAGLQQLSLAVSQVASAGRLTGDEARQLSEFFNVYEVIGQRYGKTSAEIKKAIENGATVPAAVVLESIEKQSGSLARFNGLNEKQLDTLRGQWAAFQSDMQTLVGGDPSTGEGGVFAPLTNELKRELPVLSQDLGDSLRIIAPELSKAAIAGLHFSQALLPIATPIVGQVFRGIAESLDKATPHLTELGTNAPGISAKTGELVDQFVAMTPALIDLAVAMGPIIRDLTQLAVNVLPYIIGPLTSGAHGLAQLTSESKAASIFVGAAVTAFLGWRVAGPAIATIWKAVEAMRALSLASTADIAGSKGALAKGGAAALGAVGIGGLAIYEGQKSKNEAISAGTLIGGGAAIGAGLGSVVPGVGTVAGGIAGAAAGGIVAGWQHFTGDVEGNFASTMNQHRGVESMTPGSRTISSGVRNWGLASGRSGHLNGTAVDVHGPWQAAYANNVRRSGGWAKQHDAGNGLHVHAQYQGDVMGGGASQTFAAPGGPQIQMNVVVNTPMDLELAVRRGIESYERQRLVRR